MRSFGKLNRIMLTATAILVLSVAMPGMSPESGLSPVRTAAAASVEIDFFYDRLDPHGSWVDHGRHGYVFVPAVNSGWRPYVRGHWVYTDRYGWYWESDEPFGWAVYHYGRWAYDPAYSWYWVPGNVWAPAWVTWSYGGGNVGWAPIGPHGNGYVYGAPDYYEPSIVEAWVFVPERRFVAVDVARYVRPIVEVNIFLGKARDRHHVRYRDGRAVNAFLPRERVREFVDRDIEVHNVTAIDDPGEITEGEGRDERDIKTFQAEISEEEPKKRPERVASTPDEVESKPRLEETAQGDRPEGAPPSAAELRPGDEDSPRRPGRAEDRRERDREAVESPERKPDDAEEEERGRAARDREGDREERRARQPRQEETQPSRQQDEARPEREERPSRREQQRTRRQDAPAQQGETRRQRSREEPPQREQRSRRQEAPAQQGETRRQRSREGPPQREQRSRRQEAPAQRGESRRERSREGPPSGRERGSRGPEGAQQRGGGRGAPGAAQGGRGGGRDNPGNRGGGRGGRD